MKAISSQVLKDLILWHGEFDGSKLSTIRTKVLENKMPVDSDLYDKIHKGLETENIVNCSYDFEIVGEYKTSNINFTINAIDFEDIYDDEYMDEYPCLWMYSGKWNHHCIKGLASTSSLAVGKMFSEIYLESKKKDIEVAKALKNNLFKFHMYKFS